MEILFGMTTKCVSQSGFYMKEKYNLLADKLQVEQSGSDNFRDKTMIA
jgi:hypothetical protein